MQRPREEARAERRSDSTLVSRNVTVSGRRTSLRLEPAMWDALAEICDREAMTPSALCSEIDRNRDPAGSLTAAVRVFLLVYFREAATEQGHREARRPSLSA